MEGFSFDVLYNMPIYLRNFYIRELNVQQQKEKEELDKIKSGR